MTVTKRAQEHIPNIVCTRLYVYTHSQKIIRTLKHKYIISSGGEILCLFSRLLLCILVALFGVSVQSEKCFLSNRQAHEMRYRVCFWMNVFVDRWMLVGYFISSSEPFPRRCVFFLFLCPSPSLFETPNIRKKYRLDR